MLVLMQNTTIRQIQPSSTAVAEEPQFIGVLISDKKRPDTSIYLCSREHNNLGSFPCIPNDVRFFVRSSFSAGTLCGLFAMVSCIGQWENGGHQRWLFLYQNVVWIICAPPLPTTRGETASACIRARRN